jgi:hypothetical protein
MRALLWVIAAVTAPLAGPAEAVVLTVGPSGDYQTIADAVAAAFPSSQ